jgi:AcrR family transcriptional regulator
MATDTLAPSGERRRRRHRDEVRVRLLAAAADRFARYGIVNTRVETITETADVAKGTFFNHFSSKEAVAVELANGMLTDLWIVAQRARQADSVRSIVAALPQVLVESMRRSPLLFRSVFGTMLLHDALDRDFLKIDDTLRSHLACILERGQELGEIRSDRPASEMAAVLQHSLWGTLASWRDGADIVPQLACTLEIFWNGAAIADSGEESWGV